MAVLGTLAGYCDIGVLGVKGLNTRLKIIQFSVGLTSCGREVRFYLDLKICKVSVFRILFSRL